jgi:predicted permease
MTTFIQDLRFGTRMLLRSPGFTVAAALVLGLGIGANSAMFSLVNAFLLKPLVIEKPEEIVGCYSRDTKKPDAYRAFSYANYADLRDNNAVFTSLTAHNMALVGLEDGNTSRRTFADIVSSNYFRTFGVPLFRGRAFTLEEERPGAVKPVVIMSYSLWKKSGGDADILGKILKINGRAFTVAGVAPEGFTGTTALVSPEMYFPMGVYEWLMNDFEGAGRPLAARDNNALILVGRLRPGMTQKAADSQLAVVASRLEQAYPGENKDQTFIVRPLSRLSISTNPTTDTQVSVVSALLLSMAGIVLLIASLNVANMMLARGAARSKEIAIRLALGAGRGRILWQLFTEGLLLAVIGGAAGLAVAHWSTIALVRSLTRLAPFELIYNATPDGRVLAATAALCLASTLVFAFAPAWSLSKQDVVSDLKTRDNAAGGVGRRVFSRGNILVMSQLSLSLMLLTAAGLFLHSSVRASQVEPGFRLDDGIVLEVDASLAGYKEPRAREVYRDLLDGLKRIPGVESASMAATVPFGMISLGRTIERSDSPSDASARSGQVSCKFNIVGVDYFRTLGIPLLRGRAFLATDAGDKNGAAVAVLDKQAADRLWPKGDAVGRHIRMTLPEASGAKTRDAEVVGIVQGVQENIIGGAVVSDGPNGREGIQPHLYVPFSQEYQSDMSFHLRTDHLGPDARARLLESVRQEVRATDGRLPVLALKTLRNHLDGSVDFWIVRTGARMFALFGIVALLVAAIGLYGVRAYTVARRTREIGIRIAVGASTRDALLMILREGMIVTAIATGIGLALSLMLARLLTGMLYRASAVDPLVLLGAPSLLAVVSLLACYFPARRAARVEPMTALRYE